MSDKKRTFKSFKEFAKDYLKEYEDANFVGVGGFSIGSLDSMHPTYDLGDTAPTNDGSRDSRGTQAVTASKNVQNKKNKKKEKEEEVQEDTSRVPRKSGQPADSKKHSDLYTDENPEGTIQGLKFATQTDAQDSVKRITSSGRSHAHKIQAAIAMSQRAKVASERAKDEDTKKSLFAAHKVYQSYIDNNKKGD
jgi:hypothetical protein